MRAQPKTQQQEYPQALLAVAWRAGVEGDEKHRHLVSVPEHRRGRWAKKQGGVVMVVVVDGRGCVWVVVGAAVECKQKMSIVETHMCARTRPFA